MSFRTCTALFALMTTLVSTAFVGCSASVANIPDQDAAPSGPTAEQACAGLAKARCTKLEGCSMQELVTRDGDEATCESRDKAACLAALSASGTGATPLTVTTCATATTAASCTELLGNVPIAACATKPGELAANAPCGYSAQCQSAYCAVTKGTLCGTCAPLPKAGDSCATLGCGPGLRCSKSLICSSFATLDQPCDNDQACDYGLGCVQAKGAAEGACKPLVASEGAACDAKEQTAASCDRKAGLWCLGAGTCAKGAGYAKAGEACGVLDPTTVKSCTSGSCLSPEGKIGTCAASATEGGACNTSSGPGCVTGLRCVVSTEAGAGTCMSQATCK